MDDERCDTCRFWLHDEANSGECHRYPPRAGRRGPSRFPVVTGDTWCGEWQPPRKRVEAADRPE